MEKGRSFKTAVASFFITLLLIAAVCAFAVVDSRSRQFGFGESAPVFEVKQSSDNLKFSVMGKEYGLDLSFFDGLKKYEKEIFILTPVWVRFGEQLFRAAQDGLRQLRERQKMRDFERYTAGEGAW